MSGAIININYVPPYKNKKSGRYEPNQAAPATVSTLNLTAPATHGYVDYSGDKPETTKKVVKKSKPQKSAPKTSRQGYLIYIGRN